MEKNSCRIFWEILTYLGDAVVANLKLQVNFQMAMIKLTRAAMYSVNKARTFFALGEPSQLDVVFMQGQNPSSPTEGVSSATSSSSCSSPSERSQSPVSNHGVEESKSRVFHWIKVAFLGLTALAMALMAVVICKDYLRTLLVWMERMNFWAATVIFAVLFTVVSFPMMWGYIVLNVAAGYLYGVAVGSVLVIVCAFIGVVIGHELTKRFLNEYVLSKVVTGLGNESLRAILRVIEGGRAFKVVALARLTPIPYGLQNGIFAVSISHCKPRNEQHATRNPIVSREQQLL